MFLYMNLGHGKHLAISHKIADRFANLVNVILFIFSLLYINKIIITIPYKRNRIETKSII